MFKAIARFLYPSMDFTSVYKSTINEKMQGLKPGIFQGVGTRFGSLESEKVIIGSLQVHSGHLIFSLKITDQNMCPLSGLSMEFSTLFTCAKEPFCHEAVESNASNRSI